MRLKIYSEKKYLAEERGCVPFLYPFWKSSRPTPSKTDWKRYDQWTECGDRYIEMTSLAEADVIVLPSEWRTGYAAGFDLDKIAGNVQKPLIVFYNSDSTEQIPLNNAIIFRTSIDPDQRCRNEFGLPAWSNDFTQEFCQGKVNLRKKKIVPVVSYTGYIDYRNTFEWIKFKVRKYRGLKASCRGAELRGKAVRKLLLNNHVKCVFIIRDKVMTGSASQKQRFEYAYNIINSDYSLAVRGRGNFSYRLYEIMSCGRIPLYIDSGTLFPYHHEIDWNRYMVSINQTQLTEIDETLMHVHSKFTADEFEQLQRDIRGIYLEFLSPVGFHKNLWRCIPLSSDKKEKFLDKYKSGESIDEI